MKSKQKRSAPSKFRCEVVPVQLEIWCYIDQPEQERINMFPRYPVREGRIKTICNLSSIRALPVGHYQSKKNERIKSPYQR